MDDGDDEEGAGMAVMMAMKTMVVVVVVEEVSSGNREVELRCSFPDVVNYDFFFSFIWFCVIIIFFVSLSLT